MAAVGPGARLALAMLVGASGLLGAARPFMPSFMNTHVVTDG